MLVHKARIAPWLWFLTAFFLALWFLVAARIWEHDWMRYFFMTNRYGEMVALYLILAAITLVVIKLLQWQFRVSMRHSRRHHRRGRH
jgi:hypothetical protein